VFFVVVLRIGLFPILELFLYQRKAQNVVQERAFIYYWRLHFSYVTLALLFLYLVSIVVSICLILKKIQIRSKRRIESKKKENYYGYSSIRRTSFCKSMFSLRINSESIIKRSKISPSNNIVSNIISNSINVKYSTQTSMPANTSTNNSIHNRHSTSTDLLSVIRSFALKPFKTSSMTNAMAEGQTNNVVGGHHIHTKPPVSLLKYRPLSDNLTHHTTCTQSTRVCI
jgi:hypothetical protein